MTIATATISGQFVGPDLTGGHTMKATYEAYALGSVVTYTGMVIGGKKNVPIQPDGTATLTLPKIPQSGLLPSSGVQWHVQVKVRGTTLDYYFNLTTDTTWDQVLVPSNAAAPPGLIAQAEAAAASAAASASIVSPGQGWAQPLMSKLAFGQEDANLAVLGDSTSAGTTRFVYLLSQNLATDFPAYTVKFRAWNDGTQGYDAAVTIQTGSGSKTLTVYNGSTSGQVASYSASRLALQIPATPDLVLVNYGHNETASTNYFPNAYLLQRALVRAFPGVPLVLCAQNARADSEKNNHLIRMRQLYSLAGAEGFGVIDFTRPFLAYPSYATALLNGDLLHPNDATGSPLMATIAHRTILANSYTAPRTTGQPVTRIWLPCTSFNAIQWGAATVPVPTHINNIIHAMPFTKPGGLDTQKAATTVHLPDYWNTWDLTFYWTTNDTATGNVAWTVDNIPLVAGSVLTRSTDTPKGAPAPGVATQLQAYKFYAAWTGPTNAPRDFQLTVGRVPGNAADTYANAAYLLGICLDRTT